MIKDGKILIVESFDSFEKIALHVGGRISRSIIFIPLQRMEEFQNSEFRNRITQSCEWLRFYTNEEFSL